MHRVRNPTIPDALSHRGPSRGSARLGGGRRPEPTLSSARQLSQGFLLALGEYPDSWMVGGDDRDVRALELDGWFVFPTRELAHPDTSRSHRVASPRRVGDAGMCQHLSEPVLRVVS